ncbi:MAG TPA: response regulator [Tepidisphaeraceae bacterium]|jgi:FixJ family two-component response regulator|nr:response regulator [Tepidisphaeraceae bacterium]
MTPIRQAPQTQRAASPHVLIVDDESDVVEFVGDALSRNLDCRFASATTFAEASRALQSQAVDLLIVDLNLPDGRGAELLATLRQRHPLASAIVVTGSPSVETAVSALRDGAVDFLAKPFTVDEFLRRIRTALHRNSLRVKSESRIDRLRVAVRRLNDARRLVTKKVDLLCNDLVAAYGDLSRQLDLVRTTESFRGVITSSNDLEQMLCHSMDWLLRQVGYANVAIWLAGPEPDFQLGAYMKYTVAGDPTLTEAMRSGLLQIVRREGLVHFDAEEANKVLSAAELRFMRNQTVLAIHCTYLGESLASIVLFREGDKPFCPEDVMTLRAIGPVFAIALATMVRGAGDEQEMDEPEDEDDGSVMDEPDDSSPGRRRKKDDSEWWKRGEPPPF